MVRIRLLGGVGAETDDGRPLDVGTARTRTLLAALALSAGTPVPVPRLIDLVWADDPPGTGAKALQWHVARLRAGLGAGTVVRTGAAYRLDVPPDAVDVDRFRRHLRAGDPAAALAEWRGVPLAGVDAPGLAAAVAGLTEQWLGAIEADLVRRTDADAYEAVAALTELVGRYPLREGLWALLMTALARTGRRADALAAYRGARRHLVGQLGIEPGPRLRELEARILTDREPSAGPALKASAAPPSPSLPAPVAGGGGTRGNLPRPLGPIVGRDACLRGVGRALADAPVVTLVGPGGIGKTRLALAAARRAAAADGAGPAWYVELAEVASPDDVPRAVADTLGAAQRAGRNLTDAVVAALGSGPALLLVDNCEHVLDGAARLVRTVAERCAGVRVLATSRERLDIEGEQVLAVGPLDVSAGAELFHVRALAADRAYARPRTRRRWRTSAAAWTAYRSRSNWRPPGSGAIRRRPCWSASTTNSVRPGYAGPGRPGTGAWGPRSTGRTGC
ncbi:BTAD domain-containing putative transcriptional regulator [Streptomyces sp. NPDC086023]|uniref:AfsR/SARP family transcriptional regulator n=1 Tax=Streptomyces sp. NPDC086023 TaxID=3365746 RepID=UPI0037CF196B